MPRHYSKKATKKIGKVMEEFHEGELTTHGRKVTDPGQAKAIAISEAREAGYKVPSPKEKKSERRLKGKKF